MESAHIILIEDNPADVLLVKLALQESGIEFTLAEFPSGAEAVEALFAKNATTIQPDAVLLDLNTPCTDGFKVLNQLQHRFSGVPIAILTSSRAQADKRRAAQRGVRYVEKPSELPMFLASIGSAVKEMLADGRDGAAKIAASH